MFTATSIALAFRSGAIDGFLANNNPKAYDNSRPRQSEDHHLRGYTLSVSVSTFGIGTSSTVPCPFEGSGRCLGNSNRNTA
jgi:hypothetical protein